MFSEAGDPGVGHGQRPGLPSASCGFLLDPRRLTVALSRTKRKKFLVASRSTASHFSTRRR